MLYHIFNILSETDLSIMVKELMMCPEWVDGARSASGGAKQLKRNIQLFMGSDTYKNLNKKVCDLIMSEKTILKSFVYPKRIINTLFSRTSAGMYYGKHIDIAYTDQGRRDYSFTLFLSDPSEYEGGELILNIPPEQKSVKLEAGSIIIYPTKYLHEVKEVFKGERMVCVGWIESRIKNDIEREILGNIATAMALVENNDDSKSMTFLNIAYQKLQKHFGD